MSVQEVRVPELGENIEQADVTSVLVEPGERVEKDAPLIEVESDKASLEVPAPFAGEVKEIRIKAGQKIKVGQVILTIDSEAGGGASDDSSGGKDDGPPADASGKADGGKTDGASKQAGDAGKQAKSASGDEASSGGAAQQAGSKSDSSAQKSTKAGPASSSSPVGPHPGRARAEIGTPAPASPGVRRLARELGADVNRIEGTGPRGRISYEDVKQYVKQIVQRRGAPAGGAGPMVQPELPDFSQYGEIEREGMSGIRRRTAEKMAQSWSLIPHVTQFDDADITELEAFRKKKTKKFEKEGAKLTVTAVLLKVLGEALQRFPKFNASLDLDHEEIIYKKYFHVGVAVDTDRGLLVPVIRDVDRKGVLQISRELNDLAERARAKKTRPEELQGSNISLTNLGGLGTTNFTPIVNWPDVAVLGVGRAKTQAVWDAEAGQFAPRMILPLSLSYDHRIIDGADAARFLRWICEALEEPVNVIL